MVNCFSFMRDTLILVVSFFLSTLVLIGFVCVLPIGFVVVAGGLALEIPRVSNMLIRWLFETFLVK